MSHEQLFLVSLFVTIFTEVVVICVLNKYIYKTFKYKDLAFAGVVASLLTLPYLWFVLPAFLFSRLIYIFVGEILVFIIEAIIYYKILKVKWSQSIVMSLIANIVSILIGLIVF